ncbi:MAG: hypothetical protein J6Y28_09075 [Acholeplasmatales bacterium]|nr:hypothetical protein [Acholeplasmatales bacterium]
MRGLYISFVIKRRKKLDKIMDFFLVVAIFIFIFTFLFYVQFVQKQNKYNSTDKTLKTRTVLMQELDKDVENQNIENASPLEKDYNTAYSELKTTVDEVSLYSTYISDIYAKQLAGVTINGVDVDTKGNKITLQLTFDKQYEQVDYRYRAALLDLSWIPKGGIKYEDTNTNTKWEVLVDGTTTKK